jgi:ribosome maturation factor RimP
MDTNSADIQTEVEKHLAQAEPAVEVLLAEVVGGSTLRLFIDHPDGVSLDLCERVSRELNPVRERYALEVSSPGASRPLTKPDHYKRFIGRQARIRTRPESKAARRTYTGRLLGATDADVTIAAPDGVVTISYGDIHRSNLVSE